MKELFTLNLSPGYAAEEEMGNAKAVIAVAFNTNRRDGTPDDSNRFIAAIAKNIAEKKKLPLYAQREQAELLKNSGVSVHEYPEREHWVPTHVLMRWFAQQIGPNLDVILAAHPDHARRAAALARFYGMNPLVAKNCEYVPYDPEGGQWWCRSRAAYIPWEYLSRLALLVMWSTKNL